MAYDPNDYSTGADYETVGDDDGEELGAIPSAAMLRRPAFGARPTAQQPRSAAARFNPATLAALRRSAAAGGITEQRVLQLIDQRMGQLVPWDRIPPRPRPDEAMFPLGLGTATFTSATATQLVLTARPQRAFRGERLILTQQKSLTAPAQRFVTILDFKVGDVSQKVGGGAIPVEVFASDAFGVRLMIDAAVPGVDITVTLQIDAAPGVGDSVSVSGAIIGRATESQG